MLSKKKNKFNILRKSEILSLYVVTQVFYSIFFDNNNSVMEVIIRKMGSYLDASYINAIKVQ